MKIEDILKELSDDVKTLEETVKVEPTPEEVMLNRAKLAYMKRNREVDFDELVRAGVRPGLNIHRMVKITPAYQNGFYSFAEIESSNTRALFLHEPGVIKTGVTSIVFTELIDEEFEYVIRAISPSEFDLVRTSIETDDVVLLYEEASKLLEYGNENYSLIARFGKVRREIPKPIRIGGTEKARALIWEACCRLPEGHYLDAAKHLLECCKTVSSCDRTQLERAVMTFVKITSQMVSASDEPAQAMTAATLLEQYPNAQLRNPEQAIRSLLFIGDEDDVKTAIHRLKKNFYEVPMAYQKDAGFMIGESIEYTGARPGVVTEIIGEHGLGAHLLLTGIDYMGRTERAEDPAVAIRALLKKQYINEQYLRLKITLKGLICLQADSLNDVPEGVTTLVDAIVEI